jgi:hypothetical protein
MGPRAEELIALYNQTHKSVDSALEDMDRAETFLHSRGIRLYRLFDDLSPALVMLMMAILIADLFGDGSEGWAVLWTGYPFVLMFCGFAWLLYRLHISVNKRIEDADYTFNCCDLTIRRLVNALWIMSGCEHFAGNDSIRDDFASNMRKICLDIVEIQNVTPITWLNGKRVRPKAEMDLRGTMNTLVSGGEFFGLTDGNLRPYFKQAQRDWRNLAHINAVRTE